MNSKNRKINDSLNQDIDFSDDENQGKKKGNANKKPNLKNGRGKRDESIGKSIETADDDLKSFSKQAGENSTIKVNETSIMSPE
jgi:hypothetical protein